MSPRRSSRRRAHVTSLLLGAIALSGCQDQPTQLVEEPEGDVTTPTFVASAIARALNHDPLRSELLAAWRSSPWVEHKLSLREALDAVPSFLPTLEAEMGRASGMLDGYLEYDFYVPGREDRLSWTGSAGYVVALMESPDGAPEFGFTPTESVRFEDVGPSANALIVLHPPEHRNYRIDRQADVAGPVIQDPDDGEVGIELMVMDGEGNEIAVDLGRESLESAPAALRALFDCDPTSFECPGGGAGNSVLRVKQVTAHQGDGVGSVEIRYSFSGATGASASVHVTGLNQGSTMNRSDLIMNVAQAGGSVSYSAVETDFLADDYWGGASFAVPGISGSRTTTTTQVCQLIGTPTLIWTGWYYATCAQAGLTNAVLPTQSVRVDWGY